MKNKQCVCPVTNALTILGGKWKINIIFQLSQNTMRFGALRRSLGDVTQQMLTKQLREMERDKLINRKVYDVVPPKENSIMVFHGDPNPEICKDPWVVENWK